MPALKTDLQKIKITNTTLVNNNKSKSRELSEVIKCSAKYRLYLKKKRLTEVL